MGGRIYPLVFFVFVNIISRASCKGNGSLTFLIDDTSSMYNDIDQVRSSVNQIMDTVFNEQSSLIDNMVLVTFNDPDAEVRVETRDRDLYKNILDQVKAHNNYNVDCWEPSMNGLLLALERSNRDSYMYVFTDAPARDYADGGRVIELCQRKQIQIVFVLTGNCRGRYKKNDPDSWNIYYKIAEACSGLAFDVDKNEVSQVLGPIKQIIKGEKSVIATATIEANTFKAISFTIDDHTDYAIISISGKNVGLHITGPSKHLENLMQNDHGRVVKLSNTIPGTYVATVGSNSKTSIIIIGRTDFLFSPGFSESKPKSSIDASPQPIADTKVYLSASITDEYNSVQIVSAHILQMDENVIKELPLKEVSKDFYVSEQFVAPSQMFKVAVNGIIKNTGKPIRRFAKLPVTSIPQPRRPPTAVIVEGRSLRYEYNDEFKLTCKIEAYPEPKITWVNSKGTTLSSSMARKDVPYEYISYIKTYATKDDTYVCYAVNDEGKASASAIVTIKDPFDVKQVPSQTTKVVYGSESTITCDIRSKFPMEIHWYHRNDVTGISREIQTSDKYLISTSQTQLKIRKMDLDLDGYYFCKAFLKNQKGMEKRFHTRVAIDGLAAPKLVGKPNIKVTKGKIAVLECKVLNGVPAPKITWLFGGKSGTAFAPIPSTGNVLRITNVGDEHGGQYKCVAENGVAIDEHVTTLTIQDLPKIHSRRSEVYIATEGEVSLSIPCVATGVPKPVIIWKINNLTLNPGKKYAIKDGTLIIRDPSVGDTNSYTCIAQNDVGLVSETFKTFIRQMPKLRGDVSKKVVLGSAVNIECRVYEGVPTPKITWQYIDNTGKNVILLHDTEQVLHISKMENKHAGRYKCVAHNEAGSAEHITTLVVQDLPKILSSTSTDYKSTEGDALLRIPCVATGLPKPSITWKLNGSPITPNAKYSIEDGALVIRNPTVSDSNSYTCEATNEAGSDSATFKTHIRQMPKLSGVATKNVRLGQPAVIECTVNKGEPKPKITWFMANSGSEFVNVGANVKTRDNVLQITSAEDRHAGRYKCVAQNDVGSAEHVTTLVVESPPTITSNSTTISGMEGDVALRVPCDVTGVPRPVITWKLNGATIAPNSKYNIEDGNLVIMNPTLNDTSTYTCEAKNYIDSVSATFKVNIDKELDNLGTKHYVYMLLGETRKLECDAYKSKSQSIRWFKNFGEMKKETSIQINTASYADDSNYTCHVSDEHGNVQTHTYVVDVGSPPKLYESNTLDNWRGDVTDIKSKCVPKPEAKPDPKITWTFNGKELTDQEVPELGIGYKWGHYTCNVSNVHGSVMNSFDVSSSVCLTPRNLRDVQHMPFVLTNEVTWPKWEFTAKYIILEPNEKVTLSCPSQKEESNTFINFPKENELKAHCVKEDTFLVNGKNYKLSDLQCTNSIQFSVVKSNVKCSEKADRSELIRVGYNMGGFLETYGVCFDHAKNMPLYTRALMTKTDGSLGASNNWYTYPGIGDPKIQRGFTCKNSLSSCCYGKSQLVNAKDFNYETVKNSTFIDYLNGIPIWRPCDTSKTSWENILDMLRDQLSSEDTYITWSGTHTFEEKHGAVIPRYLWKVIRFDNDQVLAIVHVNNGTPTEKDIKCKNFCNDEDHPWFTVSDEYTYCCSLTEFFDAFDMHGTDIGESLNGALDKIEKTT